MVSDPAQPRRIVAAVIAGGRAVRFGGRVKALLEIDGSTILDRQRRAVEGRVAEVVVSANDPAPFAATGLRVIADDGDASGPMAGISACLTATGADWLLATASDMPMVTAAVVDLLIDGIADDVDAVAPWVGGYPEPLLALYSRRCLPELRRRLSGSGRSLGRLLAGDALRVARLPEAALRAVDPDLRCLINLNRPGDLAALGLSRRDET